MKRIGNCFLMVSVILFASCGSNDSSSEDVADHKISYGDQEYRLSKGLEEVFKPDDNHSSSQINITDGEFYYTQVTISGNLNLIWRAKNASVWLYVNLYAPGFKGLTPGTYKFKPNDTDEDEPALASTYFFKKGKFAVDLNNDGKMESDDSEFIEITGGTIQLELVGDYYLLNLNLILENGVKLSGTFNGDFDQV